MKNTEVMFLFRMAEKLLQGNQLDVLEAKKLEDVYEGADKRVKSFLEKLYPTLLDYCQNHQSQPKENTEVMFLFHMAKKLWVENQLDVLEVQKLKEVYEECDKPVKFAIEELYSTLMDYCKNYENSPKEITSTVIEPLQKEMNKRKTQIKAAMGVTNDNDLEIAVNSIVGGIIVDCEEAINILKGEIPPKKVLTGLSILDGEINTRTRILLWSKPTPEEETILLNELDSLCYAKNKLK